MRISENVRIIDGVRREASSPKEGRTYDVDYHDKGVWVWGFRVERIRPVRRQRGKPFVLAFGHDEAGKFWGIPVSKYAVYYERRG